MEISLIQCRKKKFNLIFLFFFLFSDITEIEQNKENRPSNEKKRFSHSIASKLPKSWFTRREYNKYQFPIAFGGRWCHGMGSFMLWCCNMWVWREMDEFDLSPLSLKQNTYMKTWVIAIRLKTFFGIWWTLIIIAACYVSHLFVDCTSSLMTV